MKNQREVKKLAKLVFSASLVNNKLDENKLKNWFNLLKKTNPKKALPIVIYLEKLIERKQKQEQLNVESAYLLDPSLERSLKHKFEQILDKKLSLIVTKNQDLISGIKVTNADYTWENSIRNRLIQLRGALIND